MMVAAKPFIERNIHPSVIVSAYYKALAEAMKCIKNLAVPIKIDDDVEIKKALTCCIGTKFASRWNDMIVNLALKSVRIITKGGPINKL